MKHFTIYKDKIGEYRWRLRARNGKIICVSSEGFKSKQSCLNNLEIVKDYFYSDTGSFSPRYWDDWLEDLT